MSDDLVGLGLVGSKRPVVTVTASDDYFPQRAHKLSAQVLAAEDRIRELEASVSHHQDRADRAERWMYQISVEIEQSFFAGENSRRSQSPSPQAVSRKPRE